MARQRDRDLGELIKRIDALEELQGTRPDWTSGWRYLLGTFVTGVAIAISAPIATHVLKDDATPCSVQYDEVSKAVKSGITNPDNLAQLAHDGCSRSPIEIANDIVGD